MVVEVAIDTVAERRIAAAHVDRISFVECRHSPQLRFPQKQDNGRVVARRHRDVRRKGKMHGEMCTRVARYNDSNSRAKG